MAMRIRSASVQDGKVVVTWEDETGRTQQTTENPTPPAVGTTVPGGEPPNLLAMAKTPASQPGVIAATSQPAAANGATASSGGADPVAPTLASVTNRLSAGVETARPGDRQRKAAAADRIRYALASGSVPRADDMQLLGYTTLQQAQEQIGIDRTKYLADVASRLPKTKHRDWTPEELDQLDAAREATTAQMDQWQERDAAEAKGQDARHQAVDQYNQDATQAKRAGLSVQDFQRARQRNDLRFGTQGEQDQERYTAGDPLFEPQKAGLQRQLISLKEKLADTLDPTERQRLWRQIEQVQASLSKAMA